MKVRRFREKGGFMGKRKLFRGKAIKWIYVVETIVLHCLVL